MARMLMLDAVTSSETSTPRALGEAGVAASLRHGRTRIARLRQSGSAKAMAPTVGAPPGALDVVLLNTAGGVTGGDRFAYGGEAGDGAWLRLTTQAAERAYRARAGEIGVITTTLTVGSGARFDWLPQETILFDGSAIDRRLTVELASDARFLGVEPLIFGRAAMGERLRRFRFTDQWRVWRDGVLAYADALRLDGRATLGRRPALLAGAGAMASLLYVGDDAEDRLEALRSILPSTGGASVVRAGVLSARILAEDGFALRRTLLPALERLADAALPKVWTI